MRQSARPQLAGCLALATVVIVFALPAGALGAANSTVSFSFRCSGQQFLNTCSQTAATKGALAVHTHTDYTNPNSTSGGKTKRIQLFFDNDFFFDPSVAPRCSQSLFNVDMAEAMGRCGSSLIGTGTVEALSSVPVNGCLLLFNGPNDANGDPTIVFYTREPLADCANPQSNHGGSATEVLPATLRTTPIGDYRREIDLPRIATLPLALSDLNFTLQKNTLLSGYVKARCFDANHVWNVTGFFTYNDNTTQTVNSTRTCAVAGGG